MICVVRGTYLKGQVTYRDSPTPLRAATALVRRPLEMVPPFKRTPLLLNICQNMKHRNAPGVRALPDPAVLHSHWRRRDGRGGLLLRV